MSVEAGGKHTWISNRALFALSGIKRVCLDCGTPDDGTAYSRRPCPGKRKTEGK